MLLFLSMVNLFLLKLRIIILMNNLFKENLRKMLVDKNMSVKELAFLAGISKRSIENYLGNRASMPPADYAYQIAKVLGVSVEELVMGLPSHAD